MCIRDRYLLAQAESARLQTWTYVWLLVTTSAVAAACYLSAANFRASILHSQILRSPTAVSYTHLDVYKRQTWSVAHRLLAPVV